MDLQSTIQYCKHIRHNIHRKPELTWNEQGTAALVARELSTIEGMEVRTGIAKHGVIGLLKGSEAGPVIGLRADMDALPIQELTGLPYASEHDGVMHACGHDGHTSLLLGVAKTLATKTDRIKGSIKFIFQPAEEGGAGAKVMCDEGVLEHPKVDCIYALHGWPELKFGQVGVKAGTIMAATAFVDIKVTGKGGHAAFPHTAIDSILVGAKIVEGLQSISSRFVDPIDPVVLSVTQFHGGNTHNVIPEHVSLSGTLRTCSDETQERCFQNIRRICTHTAEAYGAKVEVELTKGYPATINTEKEAQLVHQISRELVGEQNAIWHKAPSMGAEDFAYFLEKVPGAYFYLGLDDKGGSYPSLHDPRFDFNDKALELGIKMFLGIIEKELMV